MTPVEFLFYAPNGAPIADTSFEIRLRRSGVIDEETGILMPRVVVARTNALGRAVVSLAVTDAEYLCYINDPLSCAEMHYRFKVPKLTSSVPGAVIRFQDILLSEGVLPPTAPLPGTPDAVLNEIRQARLDAIAAALRAQGNVITISPTPPSSPGDGAQWLQTTTGRHYVYYYDPSASGHWIELGTAISMNPDSLRALLAGTGGAQGASMIGYQVGKTVKQKLDELSLFDAKSPDGSTVLPNTSGNNVINLNVARDWTSDVTGAMTLANPSAKTPGQRGSISLTIKGTPPHTLSFGSQWKSADGVRPTLSTVVDHLDILHYTVISATAILVSITRNVR